MSPTGLLDRIDLKTGGPARQAAAARFCAHGWPDRRSEAWHYTDVNARLKSFDPILAPRADDITAMMPDTNVPRIAFANGHYDESRSTEQRFSKVSRPDGADTLGSTLPMVNLNAALAESGVLLAIPDNVDAGTICLVSVADVAEDSVIALRHRITVGAGGSLTLIDVSRGRGPYLHSQVFEITLGVGAALRHYRLQDDSGSAVHVTTVFAEVAADAKFASFLLNSGARLSRNEIHATASGRKADIHLNAAQLLAGTQLGDITTVIAHDAPDCASRQTVKSVLADHARGVFQGRIEVARVAQKTDGYQMNQALLLSPDAEIDIKPELEIFADDVKCSHGATIGALDPEQLFYLRSRGIPESEARALLIRAFIDEALEPVADDDARRVFETAIEDWWHKGIA